VSAADRPEATAADETRCAVHGLLVPCLGCAAVRKAERDGVTVEDVYDGVRRGDELAGDALRTCALDECTETFVPRNERHRFCTPAHRAAGHRRVRTDGAP